MHHATHSFHTTGTLLLAVLVNLSEVPLDCERLRPGMCVRRVAALVFLLVRESNCTMLIPQSACSGILDYPGQIGVGGWWEFVRNQLGTAERGGPQAAEGGRDRDPP